MKPAISMKVGIVRKWTVTSLGKTVLQKELLDLCRARGVWLIADEVYNRLAFGRNSAPTILDVADPEDRLIVINSFSKSWAMTGDNWRMAGPSVLANKPHKMRQNFTLGGWEWFSPS